MTLVLIVEDEARIARAMQITLQAHGYQALTVGNGADALQAAAKQPVEIVVLDLGLPDMDGVEIIRRIRGWSSMPIIVLSARHASEDKVEALDAGADDYVTKPFGLDELLARLRVASRPFPHRCRRFLRRCRCQCRPVRYLGPGKCLCHSRQPPTEYSRLHHQGM